MIIEVRPTSIGLGYRRQRWPKTVHHITQVFHREVRVIVDHDEQPGVIGLLLTIAARFMF